VGTGTLNDLARFCATRLKIPYFVVATAPSMDGFASGVIPVTRAGMKVSYIGITPEMVIGDLDILAASPLKLMAAGFGDIIGKVPARLDWMFGKIAFGEAMCPEIEALMNSAVEKCIESSPELNMRTYEAAEGVMEALALAGIAMQMNGNSRPASGAEHHMSHFLEMRDGHYSRPNAYHGAKVGMTSLISMRLYEKFFEAGPPPQGVVPEAMETRTKATAAYGEVGDAVIEYKGEMYIGGDKWEVIKQKITENWDVFKANVDGFGPLRKRFEEILAECSGPVHPKDLGYTKEDIYDAIMNARMIRRIPTILEILANWGYLEKYATEIIDELF
jgi:glycerol-1-phosphate dehydrogenase [NAD(P)+]